MPTDLILHPLQDLWLVSSCKHLSCAKPGYFQLFDSKNLNLDVGGSKIHSAECFTCCCAPLQDSQLTKRAPALNVVSTFSECAILAFIPFNTIFAWPYPWTCSNKYGWSNYYPPHSPDLWILVPLGDRRLCVLHCHSDYLCPKYVCSRQRPWNSLGKGR